MRVSLKFKILILIGLSILFISCQKRAKAVVIKSPKLKTPISCMALSEVGVEKGFLNKLRKMYDFNQSCSNRLYISYKRDITCNSSYNAVMKNTHGFPKSYLKFELKRGLDTLYSYYIDLYNNVDIDDIENEFKIVRDDLLKPKEEKR
jgi:hypothetical protein